MTDGAAAETSDAVAHDVDRNFVGAAALAALIGVGLAWAARTGATALLVAVAVVQALFAFSWVLGLRRPGRNGALIIAALAAGFADTAVSVWPGSKLGALLAAFALTMPVLFVHQLSRGAARVRVLESLGGVAVLVLAVVALPALLQLRHEFGTGTAADRVAFGVVLASAGALVAGFLVDVTVPAPRFDASVPRGLLAVLGSVLVGAALGHLVLRDVAAFTGGRGLFVGASLGALVALFAVAAAFLGGAVPLTEGGFARRCRPVVDVVLPLALVAPIGLLLCLAVRA